ncbi:MAG: SDR family NAD(P)-dependent oxidoreductase [Acidiferrobacterales bacterium]|nr:SDR family NAD(P)-dependent oxidoreductase [Acidiferrobacterales bacterium]
MIGMACRFPGASSISEFWELLESGGNSVCEIVPGSGNQRVDELFPDLEELDSACRYCAFVDGIDGFDAGFFRISPVEADFLDPQQRMMLETSWHALEDAGIDPDQLMGSRTGVYTGISNDEYRMLVVGSNKPAEAAACLYALSGTNLNGTSGRVSFVLGLRGPSKAVDAACASSLVSVHDAVSDLQQGKADLAIAGGVQAILSGRIFELRADAMMLSPDGQCKAFDDSANGYVRGEGCGAVVLKRLSDAERDGDRIWGVIRGSAVNHGGASSGLTVPHTPALEQVMEEALSQAGITASQVDYLEAHGTGTSVGDPIEINAVASVYGNNRMADRPLLVGSVKTNVGHLESAAGIAGLIKAVLVMQRGTIPKHLHFNNPNSSLDWNLLPVQVVTSMMDLPQHDRRPRLAGVNSFGISGTNAHIVVEEYCAPDKAPYEQDLTAGSAKPIAVTSSTAAKNISMPNEELKQRASRLLPLSGKSAGARALAERYLSWLDAQAKAIGAQDTAAGALLSDMAWTASVGRSHFSHRTGIVFEDVGSLREQLRLLVKQDDEIPQHSQIKVAFVYTGQGSQWTGMGQMLYESEPVARAVFDRCEQVFREQGGASLLDVMFARDGAGQGRLDDTAWEQPALYALECALTALWNSVGIRPDVVVGHSVGELAAAQAAGVYSLEDGMRFAQRRGTILSNTQPGAMAAVFAPHDTVASIVEQFNSSSSRAGISVSADNGSHQVVSGPVEDIESICKRFEVESVRTRRLNTKRAFHSALLDPALDALETSLDDISIKPAALAIVSNLTGRPVETGQLLEGAYWRRHAREPVAFAAGTASLAQAGVGVIVEIGPRPLLGAMTLSAWPDCDDAQLPTVLASMHPPKEDAQQSGSSDGFFEAVAQAYRAGLRVNFEGLYAGEQRRRIAIPNYPFQRERHWLDSTRERRRGAGHPLLGDRYESASGEVTFETEISASDPQWMSDHRVFGRVVAPGALYGAMSISAALDEGDRAVVVEDMQLLNALIFQPEDPAKSVDETVRRLQLVVDSEDETKSRRVRIFSKGSEEGWTNHVECRVLRGAPDVQNEDRIDPDSLKSGFEPVDAAAYYRARSATGIDLDSSFRTLGGIWCRPGEALGEVTLPSVYDQQKLDVHPLVLDGCFQVVAAARTMGGVEDETTYMPFGWKRLWIRERLPRTVLCHVQMTQSVQEAETQAELPAEAMSGEIRIYDSAGHLIGALEGYTVKRATRAALLSAVEGVDDLLYEIVWREVVLAQGMVPADFLPSPADVARRSGLLAEYLAEEGVSRDDRSALLNDLEQWSRRHALATLEKLGWKRETGATLNAENLRQHLGVEAIHKRLFRRILELLAKSGILEQAGDGFVVRVGPDDPLPDELPEDIEEFVSTMVSRYRHGTNEIGLFRRCGGALADVLRAKEDPLTLLFSSGDPTPGDLYLKAPVARAANRILKETIRTLVADRPEGKRLRIIEVGAGTGSATAAILPELPDGQFDYMYTDISAGFFAQAESRFGDGGGAIEYRPLDIEKDPLVQGFAVNSYDLLIASNVLHATRDLQETLTHCLLLLAPSGQLVALENLSGQGWMDLTFGQLDGWWRFADSYRPHHALASPSIWRRALADVGFSEVEVLGVNESDPTEFPDKGVIVAQSAAEVMEAPGVWILAGDRCEMASELATRLAARNQVVMLVENGPSNDKSWEISGAGVVDVSLDMEHRDSWCSLMRSLPSDMDFHGAVHLMACNGRGSDASHEEMAEDVRRIGASALAMVQGMMDVDAKPQLGVWFITSGAQVLEREQGGELAGSVLWGFGKAVILEAADLQPRMIDLDPAPISPEPDLVNELLYPDSENHIAYRSGRRHVARLVRGDAGAERLSLPDDAAWVLAPDPGGVFERPCIKPLQPRNLKPKEVCIAVEAIGLNFWDVFRSLGFIEEGDLGREMYGRVIELGAEVSTVRIGDHVTGLGFGAFAFEMITREELVAPAPTGFSASDLATVPSAFVSAALSYEFSGLNKGDKVLIHAGAGGVGLAAIQLAQAAGAEVFATASAPKQSYLRSLGVENIFDSRQTTFGEEILNATGGVGVDVVLNSLTGEGFIDASLSCLANGGRFVELARRDILSEDEMAQVRPDVAYAILELDVMKKTEPARVGRVLRDVMKQLAAGQVRPIVHSRWPLAEAGTALRFMRAARHTGKIVLTVPPLANGRLRQDRTYLVTGGLGGIGCAVADWLAERGAGTIVLNGRRSPDPEVDRAIDSLRERGFRVRVELADVSDAGQVNSMLARIKEELPPLGGVIHSVGLLSDGALTNQNWQRFQIVLWPKILGAWHLHRSTVDIDLDFFILFSSRVGVMGNPGQANHAAANAFLDQLAGYRRALGLPGQAIAWGAWSEIGEAAEQRDRIERQRAARGGRWFTPQQGIKAFERLVRQDITNSVVMAMDWTVFQEAVEERPPLLEDLLFLDPEESADSPALAVDLISRVRQVPVAEREDLLGSFLQQELKAVLRLSSLPEPTVGFFDLGMDSLMSVEFRNRLNKAFADTYTASNTVVFDYPDIAALARHLASELGEVEPAFAPPAQDEPVSVQPVKIGAEKDGIAIVGMACRFPGAPDLDAFWQQLEAGMDAITDGREDPGPWHGVFGDPAAEDSVSRRGGFVEGINLFDADFFGIRPIEARTMDPRQRLLLETSWLALEDAGICPSPLAGSRTGVYIGLSGSEYRDLAISRGADDSFLGTAPSVAIGRVAFTLGFMGPAVPLDMTCSSSLVAVHQAAASLRAGEIDMALAGGVQTVLSTRVSNFMKEYGMLSSSGRCKTFDAAADGFVRGEGCGVVILKRLSDAEADGDRIWGLVRGSAVNQNGLSAALTVPKGTAQEEVIEEALQQAGIPPCEVDYLEAHATGSQLGDPIEVRAAAAVYGRGREADRPLLLGTVKTNIGHLEPAAGVAGLIKVLLAMKRGVIPKHLHFRDPNPHIQWSDFPVQVTSEMTKWPTSRSRPPRAGVSAFAISGTNAHLVVEGYEAPQYPMEGESGINSPAGAANRIDVSLPAPVTELAVDDLQTRPLRILPLSGKSEDALRKLAGRYLAWLDNGSAAHLNSDALGCKLTDMAWTAGVGRSHWMHRAGILFGDADSLRTRLASLAESDANHSSPATIKPAFAYLADDSHWRGIGENLYGSEPVVQAVLNHLHTMASSELQISLLDVVLGDFGKLDDPACAQPVIYSLQCALTALWSSIGIRPSVVFGTGAGQIAAAQAAGVLSLEDGLRIAARRGALMAALQNECPPDATALEELEAAFDGVKANPPSLSMVNQATGELVGSGEVFDGAYWYRQTYDKVRPGRISETLAQQDIDLIIEVGPQSATGLKVASTWPKAADGESPVTVATLSRSSTDETAYLEAVAKTYESGLTPEFRGLFASEERRRISLPGYPFQRQHFWSLES